MDNDNPVGEVSGGQILKIYTLGRFEVWWGGRSLFDEIRRCHKTEELLMYFLSNRGKPVYAETALENLWPDKEYSDPKNVMKNLVYRLKQRLVNLNVPEAKSYITYTRGCYGWNSNAPCWLDINIFETLCETAGNLSLTDRPAAISRYREALNLYLGHYLPECHDAYWVLPVRQYYRRLFVKSASALMTLQKESGQFSQMAEDCEKALAVEYLDENMHLFYLEALLEEGKTAQARSHYEYITALSYNESGAKPSPAMQHIYRAINSASEKPLSEAGSLQEMLLDRNETPGALHCDSDTFRLLFRLERHRAERENLPLHLGLLTLSGSEKRFSARDGCELQDLLQQLLLNSLRKVDIFTTLDNGQFTLLLPGLTLEQAEKVLLRVREAFRSDFPDKNVSLSSSVHRVMPLK
jgi:DNA-binding SARP family transcriptional activator